MKPSRNHTDGQLGFNFDAPAPTSPASPDDGLNRWRRDRQDALEALARKLGYPLGHRVELVLAGGVVLRGRLDLDEEELLHPIQDLAAPRLRIDRCSFGMGEIESCVRLD